MEQRPFEEKQDAMLRLPPHGEIAIPIGLN
jgi:hypothetical protein